MKYALLVLAILVLAACSQAPVNTAPPQAPINAPVETQQPVETRSVVDVELFVIDNEFDPRVIQATVGDVIRITAMNAKSTSYDDAVYTGESVDNKNKDTEVPYHLSVPDFGVEERLQTGDSIEFTVDKTGTFDFFCSDCTPSINGILSVR